MLAVSCLQHFLKEPVPADLNPEMLKRYPELKAMVPVKAKLVSARK
jgi:hypothetical protein